MIRDHVTTKAGLLVPETAVERSLAKMPRGTLKRMGRHMDEMKKESIRVLYMCAKCEKPIGAVAAQRLDETVNVGGVMVLRCQCRDRVELQK